MSKLCNKFMNLPNLIEALYKNGTPIFTLQDIKAYLDINPDVFNLNKHITRNEGLLKSLRNDSLTKESFS